MKVHFLGIGGIGVSALAQYYLAKGHTVSGSDLMSSEITDYLANLGVKLNISEKVNSEMINVDLVIYSPAIKPENTEFKFYKDNGTKCFSYPEALGELTKEYFTIAICGSHGKSTTTAMTALALIKAGIDPTVIVGTKLAEFSGTNFRLGQSKYLVIEACEYEESFLSYWPKVIVITNIEAEHLDYFKNLKNVLLAFKKFTSHLPKNGVLIYNSDDKNASIIARSSKAMRQSSHKFSIKSKDAQTIKKIVKIPGKHNVYNALAALQVARELKIEDKITLKSLSEYKGSWRRFEVKQGILNNKKITVISDYAHHPTEVLATLKATREKFSKNKIWCIFQPHQYQRTFLLVKDFIKVFRTAKIDNIIITDIYGVAGREDKKTNINSQKLVESIKKKNVIYIPFNDILGYLKSLPVNKIKTNDVLIIMGAGDIYKLYDKF
jgi:UDP-N-acetylmuramate--alanine ligase